MTSVNATFDGEVVRTDEPLPLPPNARVTVSYETVGEEQEPAETTEKKGEHGIFFRTARSLKLEGPPDWSERFDEYLNGERLNGDR
jgi:hypothetical protein